MILDLPVYQFVILYYYIASVLLSIKSTFDCSPRVSMGF